MGSLDRQTAHSNAANTSGTWSDIIRFPGLSHEILQDSVLQHVRLRSPKTLYLIGSGTLIPSGWIDKLLFLTFLTPIVSSSERLANPKIRFESFHRILHPSIDMRPHGFGGFVRSACYQNFHELLMRARGFLISQLGSDAIPGGRQCVSFLDSLAERGTSRAIGDAAMKFFVQGQIKRLVGRRRHGVDSRGKLLQLVPVFRRCDGGEQPRGL